MTAQEQQINAILEKAQSQLLALHNLVKGKTLEQLDTELDGMNRQTQGNLELFDFNFQDLNGTFYTDAKHPEPTLDTEIWFYQTDIEEPVLIVYDIDLASYKILDYCCDPEGIQY